MYPIACFLFAATLLAQLPPAGAVQAPTATESLSASEQPQAASLGGNALFPLKDPDGRLAIARAELDKSPNDADNYLKLGRVQDSLLRFQDSVITYSNALGKFPNDFRFYRMRGQRLISGRKFGEAIADLQKAVAAGPGSFEASYYLGLAYYFNGEHEKAAKELARCESQLQKPLAAASIPGTRTCESLREDANFLIPLQYWRYLALRRAGLLPEAKKYLDTVSPLLEIKSTKAFYDTLLFFKGIKEINEMLAGANEGSRDSLTRTSGTAAFLFTEGERAKACSLWRRDAMDQNWDHLGVIHAESEYFRNSKGACALYNQAPKP